MRRAALLVGGLLNLGGFTTLWLAAHGRLGHLALWQITWLVVIGGVGVGWLDAVSMTTSISNFPQHRGTVVGALAPHNPGRIAVPDATCLPVPHLHAQTHSLAPVQLVWETWGGGACLLEVAPAASRAAAFASAAMQSGVPAWSHSHFECPLHSVCPL